MSESGEPIEFGDDRLTDTQRVIRSAVFAQLLSTGQPAPITALAESTGVDRQEVDDTLNSFARRGGAQLDEIQVFGMAGLSVTPTKHKIAVSHGERWTWCALDAIGIVGALGSGTITSKTQTGPVTLSLEDGAFRPDGMAIFIAEGYGTKSSVAQWCPVVDFFPDEVTADSWAHQNDVPGRGVAVTRLASSAAQRWQAILEGS